MKIRIFDGPCEKEVCLKLIYRFSEVCLVACNNLGEPVQSGHILAINSEGRITRCPGVGHLLGFKLDETGRILID